MSSFPTKRRFVFRACLCPNQREASGQLRPIFSPHCRVNINKYLLGSLKSRRHVPWSNPSPISSLSSWCRRFTLRREKGLFDAPKPSPYFQRSIALFFLSTYRCILVGPTRPSPPRSTSRSNVLGPGKTRTNCGGNIMSCDVTRPWKNATSLLRSAATNIALVCPQALRFVWEDSARAKTGASYKKTRGTGANIAREGKRINNW